MITDNNKDTIIIHANLARAELATPEILQSAYNIGAHILLLQEPYTYRNKVAGMGRYTNDIITGNKEDETPWACIVVLDEDYTAIALKHISTSHCVFAHISGPTGNFYAISPYCQHAEGSRPTLHSYTMPYEK